MGPLKTVMHVLSPISNVLSVHAPKAPKQPVAQPVATRDDAIAAAQADDEMRRRRGTAANLLLGPSGAEAAPGSTATKLLTGS